VAEEIGAALSAKTATVTAAAAAATAAATAEVATAKAAIVAASKKSVSAGTHNRAGRDGSSNDGSACDSNGARGDSSGRGESDKGGVGAASGLRSLTAFMWTPYCLYVSGFMPILSYIEVNFHNYFYLLSDLLLDSLLDFAFGYS